MKKVLFTMLVLLSLGSTAYGDEVTVDNKVYLSTSGTTDFLVFFNSDVKSTVSGIQFDVQLPAGVEFVKATNGDPLYQFGTTYKGEPQVNIVNGVLKFAVTANNPIKGTQGMFVAFKIQPSSNFQKPTDGILTGAKIFNIIESKNGAVPLSDCNFSINVTDYVVLDENSPFALSVSGTQNVLLKRTFKAGKWSTLFLPFSISCDDFSTALNTAVNNTTASYAKYNGWSCDNPVTNISIGFTSSIEDYIDAETPYIVNVSSNITELILNDVEFGKTEYSKNPISINNTNIFTGEGRNKKYATGTMTGYSNLHAMEANELFLQDNQYYSSLEGQNIKGFRATFIFKDPDGMNYFSNNSISSGARGMFTVDGNPIDDATGISSKRYISENKRVYSVTGRFMGENVDMKSLPKGIYIVDGVKIIND